MQHPFKHLKVVTKHRLLVFLNGCHLGIGFHCLFHDLSKFSKTEFGTSCKYYLGYASPVYNERIHNGYYSTICKHHTARNKHHWEYYVDFFKGNMVIKTMPYKYALEYVADVISASKTYHPKEFSNDKPYDYFVSKIPYYFLTRATKEFLLWCFENYKDSGFKSLKKKDTKVKYNEIISKNSNTEIYKINLTKTDIQNEHE
jgi:hypothetical protein